jgi:hypothetical protein
VPVEHDVAKIDPHAEFDPPLGRHIDVALGHFALHFDRTAHRVDDAWAFDEQTVAGGLDDPPAVLLDLGIANSRRIAVSAARVPSSSSPISPSAHILFGAFVSAVIWHAVNELYRGSEIGSGRGVASPWHFSSGSFPNWD